MKNRSWMLGLVVGSLLLGAVSGGVAEAGQEPAQVHPDQRSHAVGTETAEPSLEPHEPIDIEGDAELLVPGETSGNGVRGGTGTPDDPFVISDWAIDGSQQDAVSIADVNLYVRIENLVLTQDMDRNHSVGIFLTNAPHVEIRDVRIRGRQDVGISVMGSALAPNVTEAYRIRNVTVDQWKAEPQEGWILQGIHLEEADTVEIDEVRIRGNQSSGVMVYRSTNVSIRNVDVRGEAWLGVSVLGGETIVQASRFASDRPLTPDTVEDDPEAIGIYYSASRVRIEGNVFAGLPAAVHNPGRLAGNESGIRFVDNTIVPRSDERDIATLGGNAIVVRNNTGSIPYDVYAASPPEKLQIVGNEFEHLLFSITEDNEAVAPAVDGNIANNAFEGERRCFEEPRTLNLGYSCVGLKVAEARGFWLRIEDNTFQHYVGRVLDLGNVAFLAQRNVIRSSGFGQVTGQGLESLVRVSSNEEIQEATQRAGKTYQRLRSNDILRSSDDDRRFGIGLHYEPWETDSYLNATGNYWGPEPPEYVYPPEGNHPQPYAKKLENARYPRYGVLGKVDFDPWSTTPNVLSESFVQDYFSDNTGNLLPTPHPAAVLTTLLIAALATEATRRN